MTNQRPSCIQGLFINARMFFQRSSLWLAPRWHDDVTV